MPAEFDPTIQSEEIGFRGEELIACRRCSRLNAPNRLECIYCGAALDVRPEDVEKFTVRKLEAWEPGTSIVIRGDGDVAQAAQLLSLEKDQLEQILDADLALPVAWVDHKTAELLIKKLEDLGFASTPCTDAKLSLAKPPIRIAGMDISDNELALIDLNTQDVYRHAWADIVLIVQGVFSTGKIDTLEKRRLRKTTVLSETMTSTDEPVLDIYPKDETSGYRVQLAGFDYSCLGAQMGPLATENMSRLADKLRSRSPEMKVVDGYKRIRHLLTGIWDIESRKDPKGIQQTGFGQREFGVVHSTSNVEQFTRFSRLQRLML
jgi:hypothetical protein